MTIKNSGSCRHPNRRGKAFYNCGDFIGSRKTGKQMHWFSNGFKIIAVPIEIRIKLQWEAHSSIGQFNAPRVITVCILDHWSGTAPASILAYPSQTWFLSQSLQWSVSFALTISLLNQIPEAIAKLAFQVVHNISSWIKSLGRNDMNKKGDYHW